MVNGEWSMLHLIHDSRFTIHHSRLTPYLRPMSRYFLEVFYKGTHYAGSQVQANAVTVQSELEKALQIFFRKQLMLTGSSRTDAGVHAWQNYFHFDIDVEIDTRVAYNINAILPADIVLRRILAVGQDAH